MTEFVRMRVVDEDVPLTGRPEVILIDKMIVDMDHRILSLVEDILESLDESVIKEKVMSKIMVTGVVIEVVQEVDNALVIMYKFRMITPGHNWQVEICEGSVMSTLINGIQYQENLTFVNWVKEMMK